MSDFRNAFFERYAAAAIEEQKRYGIPASVTLAQMAVESGYGESSLAKQDNNYFGIKASKSWLNAGKPWSYHHDDHYNDKFCTFASPLESLEYHSKVLMANRYKACFQYNSDDHYHWISGIKAGGYATDPHYVAKIEKVIKDYGLERFDKQAIAEANQHGIQIGYARNGFTPVSGVKSQPIPEANVLLPENSRYSFPIQAEVITVTSPFGHRIAPKAGASTEHMGLDVRAQYQPVLATEDKGRVLSAKNEGKGGNVIRVEYERSDGSKYQTAYMHLSQFNVHEGDVVNAGQQIGVSGNTGNSTGPHLHFSVKKISADGKTAMIDPSHYLAEIAVRGGISTKVDYKGNDLLAQHKATMSIGDTPMMAQSQYLSELTQSQEPKDWLSFLMSQEGASIGQSGDPIGALIGSIFSGLLLMAAQLDMDDGQLTDTNAQLLASRTALEKEPEVVMRNRTGVTDDYSQVIQSSSAYFEAGMQDEKIQDNAVSIK